MRKILFGIAALIAVIATLGLTSGSANAAGTPRCQETYVTSSTTTATFTALQPRGMVGQFTDVWKHDYTVTVQPDGTFSGMGSITANGEGPVVWTESIDGKFMGDHVAFNTVPVGGGSTFAATDALMDDTTLNIIDSTWTQNIIEFRIALPVFTTVNIDGTTDFANHGEYVAAMGGGNIAAQKCVGMPKVSTQGK